MGLKRTLKRHCERCGKPQLRFTDHDTVWLWHKCDNPIPGPHCPPSEHRLTDVLVEPGDAVAPNPNQPKPTKRGPLALIEHYLALSEKLKVPDNEHNKVNLELSLSQEMWRKVAAVLREAGSK